MISTSCIGAPDAPAPGNAATSATPAKHAASLVVVHSVPGSWLPQTQTWLFDQVRFLAPPAVPHVVCDSVENLEQFGSPHLHAADDEPIARRFADRCLRKLRVRRSRGLLGRVARHHDAAVLHSHFGPEGWRNIPVASRLRLRHVVTFYGYDVNCLPRTQPRWRDRYRTLFAHVDRVLCEGEHMAECIRALGCPELKVTVHRLGVDLASIPFTPRTWDGTETLRVLLASAFREKKGLPLAIEALGRLARDVRLQITIIGDATAAPDSVREKQRITAAIDRHGLGGSVSMLGFRSRRELHEEAAAHHLLVAPSQTAADGDTEGGAPVALIEMAAAGMPIVSTRHCDIPGVLLHEETAFLAREGDVDDLHAQLRSMLAASVRWPAMGRAGRRRIQEHFDAAGQGERLTSLYRQVCSGWQFHALPATPIDSRGVETGEANGEATCTTSRARVA